MAETSTEVTLTQIPACDVNPEHGDAYADAKIPNGPWGYLCKTCFDAFACSLGTGRGQILRRA